MTEKKDEFAILADSQLGRLAKYINWFDYIGLAFVDKSPYEVAGEDIEKRLRDYVKVVSNSTTKFVITLGDLTESGSPDQVCKFKKVMGGLGMPWVPVMGNHDIWPYDRYADTQKVKWNAPKPITFEEFKEGYKSEFSDAEEFFDDWTEQGDWLNNFSFTHNDYIKFIVVDNVHRGKSPLRLPGAMGISKLYEESRQWLLDQIKESSQENLVIVSHAPLKIELKNFTKNVLFMAGHLHKLRVGPQGNVRRMIANALYVDPRFIMCSLSTKGFDVQVRNIYKRVSLL